MGGNVGGTGIGQGHWRGVGVGVAVGAGVGQGGCGGAGVGSDGEAPGCVVAVSEGCSDGAGGGSVAGTPEPDDPLPPGFEDVEPAGRGSERTCARDSFVIVRVAIGVDDGEIDGDGTAVLPERAIS